MIEDVRQFIIDALAKMQFDVSKVDGSTSLGPDDLDLESLAVADLAIQIEDTYRVKIDEDEMERVALMTIDEIAAEVVQRASVTTGATAAE
jgi:acyl carrier protein